MSASGAHQPLLVKAWMAFAGLRLDSPASGDDVHSCIELRKRLLNLR